MNSTVQSSIRSRYTIDDADDENDSIRSFKNTDWSPSSQPIVRKLDPIPSTQQMFIPSIESGWRAITNDEIVQMPLMMSHSQHSIDLAIPTEIREQYPHSEALTRNENPPPKRLTLKEIKNRANRKRFGAHTNSDEMKSSEDSNSSSSSSSIDGTENLKTILKQSRKVSLSEILQQQNLSLDDLLKGKGNALKALINTVATPISDESFVSSVKPARRLPTLNEMKIQTPRRHFFNRTMSIANKQIDSTHQSNENDKYIAISSDNRIVSTIPTFLSSPASDQNGVRRLPIGKHKLIKEVIPNIRPDLNNSSSRKKFSKFKLNTTTATTRNDSVVIENVTTVGLTSVNQTAVKPNKIISVTEVPNILTTSEVITDNATKEPIDFLLQSNETIDTTPAFIVITLSPPVRASSSATSRINLNDSYPELNVIHRNKNQWKEISSIEEIFSNKSSSISEEQVNRNENFDKKFLYSATSESSNLSVERPKSQKFYGTNFVNIIRKKITKSDVTERNPSLFTDLTTKVGDDRSDLLDLLGDRRSGSRLAKVLKQRNMTFDELIDHRKRGSSQLHLAEIFVNRNIRSTTSTQSPEVTTPNTTPSITIKNVRKFNIVTAFKNFPEFNLDSVKSVVPDDIKTDSQGSSYFTSITDMKSSNNVPIENRSIRQSYAIELPTSNKENAVHWNTDLINGDQSSRVPEFASQQPPQQRPETGSSKILFDIQRIPTKASNDPAARAQSAVDIEIIGPNFKRNSVKIENAQVPVGVRSAIIASATIVIISLTIFLIIFLTFRWRQRRRRKICYSSSFSALRGRLPILRNCDDSSKESINSPSPLTYCSTRRCSKLNTMDPNSPDVQEYLYDARRKSFR